MQLTRVFLQKPKVQLNDGQKMPYCITQKESYMETAPKRSKPYNSETAIRLREEKSYMETAPKRSKPYNSETAIRLREENSYMETAPKWQIPYNFGITT